jgi:peptidoglycan/xylan/chitin deacetylase (PgdA/CDA1 family)
VLALAAAALALGTGAIASPASAATSPVVVSLTFAAANAHQVAAAATMNTAGLKGTFYIVDGFLNAPGWMKSQDVKNLYAAGNEIGGHTVNHPDLTTVSTTEDQRQICLDRQNLTNLIGAPVTDFAYPYAAANASVEQVAAGCGYNSARGLGDVKSRFCNPASDCPVYAESTTPADYFYTKALDEVESTWTLADLQNPIIAAGSHGGGWVQYTFHHICTPGSQYCSDPQMTPTLYRQFIQWLSAQVKATGSTVTVKTVAQVINKPAKAVVPPPASTTSNGVQNPSLEAVDATTKVPTCFQQAGYGTNTPTFATTTAAHIGSVAETVGITGYSDGDAKLLPQLDLGSCSPAVTPGHTYKLGEWYKSTGVTQFAVYLRTTAGAWQYWTSSPWYAASSTYVNATWTTPAVPTGFTGISFGLNIFSNGSITTDDFAFSDAATTTGAKTAATAPATAHPARVLTGAAAAAATKLLKHPQKRGTVQVLLSESHARMG